MRLEIGPEAEAELHTAVAYYEDKAEGLGTDFLSEAERVFDELREFPEMGTEMEEEIRRFLLQRFPFSVLYKIHGDVVRIVAVMHHRQRPGYWKDRG